MKKGKNKLDGFLFLKNSDIVISGNFKIKNLFNMSSGHL